MTRPRIADICCCEGGAWIGYHRAGWDVTGVDLDPKFARRYPGRFVAMDGLEFIARNQKRFDAFHVSPPCQGYTRGNAGRVTTWPKLIPEFRAALEATGKPYVIENVTDACPEMLNPVALCGCMFALSTIDTDGIRIHLKRERLFETNWHLAAPKPCNHDGIEWFAGAYGGARRDKYEAKYVRKGGYVPKDKAVVERLLGIEHDMTWNGLFECLPPAYTEWVGRHMLAQVGGLAVAA